MDKIILTPLKQIFHNKGNILHGMKKSDPGFDGFGEAYFSTVNMNDTKGWKKHTQMTLNLIVPVGEIEFVVYDESTKEVEIIKLSQKNYKRLTIKPNLWVSFKGCEEYNLLLNLANIEHDLNEAVSVPLDYFNFGSIK